MIVRISRRHSNASISSYIYTMISMVNCAVLNGHKCYINFSTQQPQIYKDNDTSLPSNMWEWWLEQPMGLTYGIYDDFWVYEDLDWRRLCPISDDLPWNAEEQEAIIKLQAVVPKWLKFKTHVITRAEKFFKFYGMNSANTVAVSVRGTDKHVEAKLAPVQAYFDILDELVRNGMLLWIAAEESKDQLILLYRYPRAIVIKEFQTTSNSAMMIDRIAGRSGYLKGYDAVTMMLMFSMCKVLVKNPSNLGDLAAGLSTGTIVIVK